MRSTLMRFHSLSLAFVVSLPACAPDAPTKDGVSEQLPETTLVDLVEEPEGESGDVGDLSVELLVVNEEDKPIPGAWVEVFDPPRGKGIFHTDSEGIVRVPEEAAVWMSAGARGFAMARDLGPVEPGTIHLERCAWVELTIPAELELPEDPWFVSVALSTKLPRGGRTSLTAGIDRRGSVFDLYFRFGDERRVLIAAPGGPQFVVQWALVNATESSMSVRGLRTETNRITVNEEGDAIASFEVSPGASAIDEAIRAASGD